MSSPAEINHMTTRTQAQREKCDRGQWMGVSGTNDNCFRDRI